MCCTVCLMLPSNHLGVVVDGDVGSDAAVVRAKVAVWGAKPFVETMLQWKVLWSVAQMPAWTKRVQSNTERSKCLILY